jgi:hypothetical protein
MSRGGRVETGIEVVGPCHVPASQVEAALALLDAGRVDEAHSLLEQALVAAGAHRHEIMLVEPEFEMLGDAELEGALDAASSETDSMIDADGIAFEAIRAARLDEPELASQQRAREGVTSDSPFHTRTMADLLERQGDAQAARAIRSTLGREGARGAGAPSDPDSHAGADARTAAIRTLERWLTRLRGGNA